MHPSWVQDWSNTDLVLRFVNDSVLSFIGADFPDRLGSIELTIAAIDEASEVSEESITMIQGRLSGSLELPSNFDSLPKNLQEYALGALHTRQTLMACNPKSTSHFLYDIFINNPKPGHKVYTSNSIANQNLPVNYLVQNLAAYVRGNKSIEWVKEQIELVRSGEADPNGLHLKEHLTPLGQRNLLGLWVALEGAIYDLDEARHLLDEVPSDWVDIGGVYLGIDFGFHNPRVTVLKRYQKVSNSEKLICYAAIDYWQKPNSTADDLINALETFDEKYNWEYAYLPHDQPGIFKQARDFFGASRIKKAKTSVLSGISKVASFFNRDRIVFLRVKGYELCWDESTGYEWKRGRDGEFIDEPVKKNDHYPDSYRYIVYTRHYKDNPDTVEDETGFEDFYLR